jgi:hypothetical protein
MTVALDHSYSVCIHYTKVKVRFGIVIILVLQALQVGADFRATPVLRTDDLAANEALSVNDVGFRPHLCAVELGGPLAGVADSDQVHAMANEEAAVGNRIFVDADGQYGQVGLLTVKFKQRGASPRCRAGTRLPKS